MMLPLPFHSITAQSPSLCGLAIPAAADLVRVKVEKGFRSTIVCKDVRGLPAKAGAEVMSGVPVILLDPERGRNTTAIVHELLHLNLALEGFEISPRWNPPIATATGYPLARAFRFEALLYDELQHHLIAPEMKSMGLDINADFVPQVLALVHGDAPQRPPEQAIVNMLRLADNRDTATLLLYRSWLKRSGYEAEEQLASWVIDQVDHKPIRNGAEAARFCRIADERVMADPANFSRKSSN